MQTVRYYLAMKSKEVVIHVTTRIDTKDSVLSERNHHNKTCILSVPFYETSRISKYTEKEKQFRVAWQVGGGVLPGCLSW